jgi:hypothetical protein
MYQQLSGAIVLGTNLLPREGGTILVVAGEAMVMACELSNGIT